MGRIRMFARTGLAVLLAGALVLSVGSGCFIAVSARPAYVVESEPPARRHEAVPGPRAGYVWVRGYWEWRGGQWHWKSGHWKKHRGGNYHWVDGHWERRGGKYHWVEGHWERRGGGGVEKRDHRKGGGVEKRDHRK